MKLTLLMIAAVLLGSLIAEPIGSAYKLDPISRVYGPTGSTATQSFEIVNNGPDRIALTVSFATLDRDEAYVETNRDADDEFLAYPAQMIVGAGKSQTVRVAWLGTPNPTAELAYRIIVTQVPIEVLDPAAGPSTSTSGAVKVLLNYRGTILIRPAKAAPKVSVESVKVVGLTDHGTALAISLVNSGTAVGLVGSCALRVVATDGRAIELPAAMLAPLHHTRILAGSKRHYLVAAPTTLAVGPVKVSGECSVEP